MNKRIIIGITGASGAIYGIRLLEAFKHVGIETHLVVSKAGQITLAHEMDISAQAIPSLANYYHNCGDLSASIASGSFKTLGMVIAPCSMRSLGEIATGISSSLLTRAADVVLKERRKLVLMVRETPLHSIHLRNMAAVSDAGGIIAPPVPAFYNKPSCIDDIVNHTTGRVLDLFDLEHQLLTRWNGLQKSIS
ncbi:MAG: UbiX family flavin prenyltransferase [Rickettsiales bacterium]|nr:UbiX family flavin prenyltransferase [Rickettsiales bacterium]